MNRWGKIRNERTREEYNITRKEYVRIRRQGERDFERNIINKCTEEPKLFYKFVKSEIKRDRENYEDAEMHPEIMNITILPVFTKESVVDGEEVYRNSSLSDITVV